MAKRVLITGGNQGIGAELAKLHAAGGYDVMIGTRVLDRAADVVSAIQAGGGRAHGVELDLASPACIARAAAEVNGEGPLDRLVINAGTVVVDTFERQGLADVRKLFEVNTLGVIDLTQRLIRPMIERGSGHIINHASMAYVGMPTHTTYSASKAALVALSDALRRELRGTGVKVSVVITAFVETGMAQKTRSGAARPGLYRLRLPGARLWKPPAAHARRIYRALRRAPAYYMPLEARLFLGFHRLAPTWVFDTFIGLLFTREQRR